MIRDQASRPPLGKHVGQGSRLRVSRRDLPCPAVVPLRCTRIKAPQRAVPVSVCFLHDTWLRGWRQSCARRALDETIAMALSTWVDSSLSIDRYVLVRIPLSNRTRAWGAEFEVGGPSCSPPKKGEMGLGQGFAHSAMVKPLMKRSSNSHTI